MGYLRDRALTYLFVFLVVVNLAFILPRLAPGNAAQILANGGRLPGNEVALLEARFGLNQPLLTQYYLFLKGLFLTFPPDFGYSYQYYPASVTGLFFQRLPATAFLIVVSLALAILISYAAAAASVLKRGGKLEVGTLYTSILFHATPAYWIALVLLWIFAVDLKWFPMFGDVSATASTTASYVASFLWHAVLPIATMTTAIFGQIYLLLRGSTQQVLKSDYVLAVRSRGLRDRIIATRYVLRNSLLPVVSLLAFSLGNLISIAVLIEAVFGYAGIGDLFVDGVVNRDYPVLQGSFFYVATIVVIAGLLGDILLRRLDPRLR
jgi:peptide/nickel transport system permease protein